MKQTCLKHGLHGKKESILHNHFSRLHLYFGHAISIPFLLPLPKPQADKSLSFTTKSNQTQSSGLRTGGPSFTSLEWMEAWTAQREHWGKDPRITRDQRRCRVGICLTAHPGRKKPPGFPGGSDGPTRSPRDSPHHTGTRGAPLGAAYAIEEKAPPTASPAGRHPLGRAGPAAARSAPVRTRCRGRSGLLQRPGMARRHGGPDVPPS